MLLDKMNTVIADVNSQVAEREELIHNIAIALLSKNNLFILGDTGQAKSFAVNEFRKRIKGARQFEKLMSKQADEETLFGRLDLASIIPGNISRKKLEDNPAYAQLASELQTALSEFENDNDKVSKLRDVAESISVLRKALAEQSGGKPEMITEGKIPASEIVFLDELFKANEGILNSLLTALNERVWTNEGEVVKLPVISFFSASNEIPNFNNPEEKILKPLYDRFQLKVLTSYVADRDKRLAALKNKQISNGLNTTADFTLHELYDMQAEVNAVEIPDRINELMDDILCKLRSVGIAVSDRKYFNYGSIVKAEAWLDDCQTVNPKHLGVLVNYLWNTPGEINTVREIIAGICDNPVDSDVAEILALAMETKQQFEDSGSSAKGFAKYRGELLKLYKMLDDLRLKYGGLPSVDESINNALSVLEEETKKAYDTLNFTYVSLREMAAIGG